MKTNMKKTIISLLLVLTLTCGAFVCASAGSVKDAVGHAADCLINTLKTVGNAVKDTCVYVFTDDDAHTAYTSTRKSFGDMVISEYDLENDPDRIRKDANDLAEGAQKLAEGTADLIRNTNGDDMASLLQGKGLVHKEAEKALDKMADGYKQMDNDLIFDVAEFIPGAAPYVAGAKLAKTGMETMAGYKTPEEFEEAIIRYSVSQAFSLVTDPLGDKAADLMKDAGLNIVEDYVANKTVEKTLDKIGDMIENAAAIFFAALLSLIALCPCAVGSTGMKQPARTAAPAAVTVRAEAAPALPTVCTGGDTRTPVVPLTAPAPRTLNA